MQSMGSLDQSVSQSHDVDASYESEGYNLCEIAGEHVGM